MDSEVELMFLAQLKTKIDRNSTIVRNSAEFNRKSTPNIKENHKLYNGTKFRLDSAEMDGKYCVLNIGITCYKDFIGSNWSPDARKLQIKGEEMYNNKQAYMSDALGVGSFLLSSDNYVTFLKRSLDCGEAVGLWDIPGGHAEPKVIINICFNSRCICMHNYIDLDFCFAICAIYVCLSHMQLCC